MTDSPLMALRARAEDALKARFPDVVTVGFGLKERDGEITDRAALRIYVRRKKPLSELAEDEILPSEFEGVPTDIVELFEVEPLHCEDIREYPTLIGGITITTYKRDGSGDLGRGTLGFFATLDGVEGPDNVVLVSNNHVLAFGNARNGDRVYNPLGAEVLNPAMPMSPQTDVILPPTTPSTNPDSSAWKPYFIGKIHDIGLQANHSFDYGDGAGSRPYYVDAATAKLDIRISSTCNKSTGVEYANRIRDLDLNPTPQNPDGDSQLVDIARIRAEQIAPGEGTTDTDPANDVVVHKVGRRTSKTTGKVVDVYAPADNGGTNVGAMLIQQIGTDCDGFSRFAAPGDSGAAIVDDQNRLVGILFAVSSSSPNLALASHIHPLMDRLNITPITEANPPVGPAGEAADGTTGALLPREAAVVELRRKIEADPEAGPLYAAIMGHWDEIVHLVNRRRPILVAWHRAKGPAYVAHLSESARRPGHTIPREIDGHDRRTLLETMAEMLRLEASPELRAFMDAHFDRALRLVERIDDLHAYADRLAEETADG